MIENELFSLVMLKTEFVHSNEDNPNNHLPSSSRFIGGLNEKVCICLFILNSTISCGFVFVCSINVSVCFLIKSNHSLFLYVLQIHSLQLFSGIFYCFVKYFCCVYEELNKLLFFGFISLSFVFSLFGIYLTLLSIVIFLNVI